MSGIWARVAFRRDHGWAPGHMSDYLDGDLDAPARERMDRHCAECPDCHGLLAGLQGMLAMLSGLAPGASREQAEHVTVTVGRRLHDSADR